MLPIDFTKRLHQFLLPPAVYRSSLASYLHQHLGIASLFNFSILVGVLFSLFFCLWQLLGFIYFKIQLTFHSLTFYHSLNSSKPQCHPIGFIGQHPKWRSIILPLLSYTLPTVYCWRELRSGAHWYLYILKALSGLSLHPHCYSPSPEHFNLLCITAVATWVVTWLIFNLFSSGVFPKTQSWSHCSLNYSSMALTVFENIVKLISELIFDTT